jgi:hypothetical protein
MAPSCPAGPKPRIANGVCGPQGAGRLDSGFQRQRPERRHRRPMKRARRAVLSCAHAIHARKAMPRPKAEIRPIPTGIPAVDDRLQQRKFASAEEAEATAARLLRAWRGLTTPTSDGYAALERRRK